MTAARNFAAGLKTCDAGKLFSINGTQSFQGKQKPALASLWYGAHLNIEFQERKPTSKKRYATLAEHRNIGGAKTCPGAKTVQYPGSIPISGFAPRYARPTHGILSPEPEPLRHAKSHDLQSQEGALHDIRSQDMQNREICKSRKCKPRNMHREYAITVAITVYAGARNIPKALSCAVCSLYHSDHHAVWSKL